jgi:nitrous oxidase accessory protein NosD
VKIFNCGKLLLYSWGNWLVGLCHRSKVIGVTLTLLMVATLGVALRIQPLRIVHASSMIIVPDDYATIPDAVGNASAGDTVYVRAGTYVCYLTIDKPLTLRGESNTNTTIVIRENTGGGMGIWITANAVTISGFHFVPGAVFPSLLWMVFIDGGNSLIYNDSVIGNVFDGLGPNQEAIQVDSQGAMIIGNSIVAPASGAGIVLDYADYCIVARNNVTGGWVGIDVIGKYHIIAFNNLVNQSDSQGLQEGGITLDNACSNNVVVGNTLVGNAYGVSWWHISQYDSVYHNNFINNVNQAYSELSSQVWDNGYPSGGNYWNDYSGSDVFSGPYQNVTGSDGIGDTPEILNSGAADRYPLVNPVPANEIVGDINFDGKVDIKDIAIAARLFGLTSLYVHWNPLADINGDNKIDIRDISLIARNFGKSWL